MAILPRGIRNNNPGNLNFVRQAGAVLEPPPFNGDKPRFARFATKEDGLRAMRDQLIRYNRRGMDTVSQVVNTWAPSNENQTNKYIATVCKLSGFTPHQRLGTFTPDILSKLMHGMIVVENGYDPYGSLVSEIAGVKPTTGVKA